MIFNKMLSYFKEQKFLFLFFGIAIIVILFLLTLFDDTYFYKGVLGIFFVGTSWLVASKKPFWFLYFLVFWFAFENLFLRYSKPEFVFYIKYLPEIAFYLIFLFTLFKRFLFGEKLFIKTPINLAFICVLVISVLSALINLVEPTTVILGIRQLVRFILVFYFVLYCQVSKQSVLNLLKFIFGIVVIQIILAFGQVLSNGALDAYLLQDKDFYIGDKFYIEAVEQYWTPGQRVFGTFRRYNEFASFLTIIFCIVIGIFYSSEILKKKVLFFTKNTFLVFSGLLFITLILTYSRSAWLAVLLGLCWVALIIKKDKRFFKFLAGFIVLISLYLGGFLLSSGLNLNTIIDQPTMNLAERILEPFSKTALRGSYDGFGRVYFWINTPKVVALSPVFGVGPGMYGGGVASSLNNKNAYDKAGIEFGIYGDTGQIDNNWLSIWGELGTLGLICVLLMYIRLYFGASEIYKKSKDSFIKIISLALMAMVIVACTLALFGPYFEIRSFAFYFWLIAGCVFAIGKYENLKVSV